MPADDINPWKDQAEDRGADETKATLNEQLDHNEKSQNEDMTSQGAMAAGAREGSVHSDQSGSDNSLVKDRNASPMTKKEKIMAHFKRFWIWYAVGIFILLAILLPITFTIIVPRIVQNVIDGNDLPIYSGSLSASTPTSLKMEINTAFHVPLGVKIDPLNLQLYNIETPGYSPFLNLSIPTLHIKRPRTNFTIPMQDIELDDVSELTNWFGQFFLQEQTNLGVRAVPDVSVHLGALHSTNKLDKTLSIPTLQNLKGANIEKLNILVPPDSNGYNINGNLSLPNYSPLSLGLGDLTLNLMSKDLKLGLVHLDNLVLAPGNNTVPFYGNLYLNQFSQNLGALLDGQKEALNGGYIEINATGNTAMVNGQTIPYLQDMLATKTLVFHISVITFLSDVINGILGGDRGSIVDVLSEVLGNQTLIENTLNNFNVSNHIQGNATARGLAKRKIDIRAVMAKNILRWGMRKPSWQGFQERSVNQLD
ncbi:hypothetical protein EJ05DRAFT_508992 [Pseudovirgaria hyperparasitica]|uniref:Uncharacterized protein n=1 Tax=Pseudovirgaria hyperparasitica TaxID=470096 RepID=A0A6A6WCA0_9PEZI|nr:uncharacterized protein EJ05DRAFT_508992 [Pseudovirgaria hyperparasitica]KAF2760462.1 hypothetical protein EJ05DRAFT_508992 [Pseudovirgaria hyperparasitica]